MYYHVYQHSRAYIVKMVAMLAVLLARFKDKQQYKNCVRWGLYTYKKNYNK